MRIRILQFYFNLEQKIDLSKWDRYISISLIYSITIKMHKYFLIKSKNAMIAMLGYF